MSGTMPSGRMPTKGWQNATDLVENRRRVADYVDGTSMSYESTELTVGASPVIIDFFTDTGGKIGHKGWLIIDGAGDVQVEFSADGTNYGGVHTLRGEERISLDGLSIRKIRLTATSDSAYRAAIF